MIYDVCVLGFCVLPNRTPTRHNYSNGLGPAQVHGKNSRLKCTNYHKMRFGFGAERQTRFHCCAASSFCFSGGAATSQVLHPFIDEHGNVKVPPSKSSYSRRHGTVAG